MRILIHAANLTAGGGLSIGKEILRAWKEKGDSVLVLASPPIATFLEEESFPQSWQWKPILSSPGSSLRSGRAFRKKAAKAERIFQPDVVFTIFGPPLWRPHASHLCGFANGLYLGKKPVLAFGEKGSFSRTMRHRLRRYLVLRSMQKDTDAIWVETEAAREKLRTLIGEKEILVVPNELSASFQNSVFEEKKPPTGKWKVLMLAAGYPHKNFSLLRAMLRLPGLRNDFLFQTTLPDAAFQRHFSGVENVENLGPLSGEDLLTAYRIADLVFCPSVAEIFSATWIEAMAAKRPLLCADIPEARAICGDAALYFDGYNPQSAANALRRIMGDEALRKSLVEEGTSRLRALTPEISRAEKLYQTLFSLNRRK